MSTFDEADLRFDFQASLSAERFDRRGRVWPKGMSPVDFIVDTESFLVLVEVKDPSNPQAPEKERASFLAKMKTDELVSQELVPKARSTYTYLHLMKRDDKPMRFVVVLGIERLAVDPVLLQNLADRVKQRLAQEADKPWERRYVDNCSVVSISNVARALPGLTVRRISLGG